MQKIATVVFMCASVMFGIVGIATVLTQPTYYGAPSDTNQALQRALFILAFIILPSFALSVAGKYLRK